ncbi:MAG: sigma-54 dependent transcriptional regulator [Muribaculaceae bacterium]|nr:sigma-54 dependent transcriptional regulator [Muribaculaceae bacterium]MDE6331167.1 sigma-54 dependent transcriptional regulator [Muribaculaceae bacterium]
MQIAPNNLPEDVQQAKLRFGIVGSAPALLGAVQRAIKVAPIDLSVLVVGESGAGKEFFPKIIHAYSARKHAKYIAVNCGAIPEGTIDSELFGHEKGSFTGAVASRKGYFEEADGGTIFLDEVAELPLTTQARLLRVLESGEFLKVGSSTVQHTNIRVVAATNVDMTRAVAEGRFREDLYYRLSTVQISVPPLRERGSDILLLARKFASDFSERYRLPSVSFSDESRQALLHYRWPGNVRQLKNVVEQIALFETGNTVDVPVLRQYLPANATVFTPTLAGNQQHDYHREREMLFNLIFRMQQQIDDLRARMGLQSELPPKAAETVDEFEDITQQTPASERPVPVVLAKFSGPANETDSESERRSIRDALERNDGRRKAAARELNISERTLYRKIKEYGLE